jgi:hypothetical protein
VQIFKLKTFARFARRERINDARLWDAVDRAERGLVSADLGGGLIKQRLARPGQGKSGGYRVIIAFRSKQRAVFVFGFAKNEVDNIDDDQLATLRETAALWLAADVKKIERAIKDELLIEVKHGSNKKEKD